MKYRLAAIVSVILLICSVLPLRAEIKLKTVVIDAGHGGTDAGCVSADKKTYEKNIALTVAKSLSDKIHASYPDVKVILTRSTDVFVPLNERADIANRNNADLFISIHVNSVANTSSKTANGYSVHVLGQSSNKNRDLYAMNMDLCKRENAVITLEDNYKETYQGFDPSDPESFIFFSLMQNTNLEQSLIFAEEVTKGLATGPITRNRGISQDPFLVLWRTTMPSALVEIGFMSNTSDLAKLREPANLDKIAQGLFNGFKAFKAQYENTSSSKPATHSATTETSSSKPEAPKTVESKDTNVQAPEGTYYGVQVIAIGKELAENDSCFKGYKPVAVRTTGSKLIKYIVCTSSDRSKVMSDYAKVKAKFPDSFVVKVEGESITRIK